MKDPAELTLEECQDIIRKHNLCHDLHGQVGRKEFEEGCRRETVNEYGSCGWADQIEVLKKPWMTSPRYFQHGNKSVVLTWKHAGTTLYVTISQDTVSLLCSSQEGIMYREDCPLPEPLIFDSKS